MEGGEGGDVGGGEGGEEFLEGAVGLRDGVR